MAARVAPPSALPGNVEEGGLAQRPMTRSFTRNPPIRPPLKRKSPLEASTQASAPIPAPAPAPVPVNVQRTMATRSRAESLGDSSDDEGAAPALSAAAEELLRTQDRLENAGRGVGWNKNTEQSSGSPVSRATRQSSRLTEIAQVAPKALASPSPRVVRISRNSPLVNDSLRRTNSTSSVANGSPRAVEKQTDLKTPATRPRSALASSTNVSSSKPPSGASAAVSLGSRSSSKVDGDGRNDGPPEGVPLVRPGFNRSQNDERGPHNSIRIKRTERVGGFTGNFLKGPARRGMIRRPSDEEQSPVSSSKAEQQIESAVPNDDMKPAPSESPHNKGSPHPGPNHVRFANSAEVDVILDEPKPSVPGSLLLEGNPIAREKPADIHVHHDGQEQPPEHDHKRSAASNEPQVPVYKVPPPLPSLFDQENDPPPTFKRNKAGLDVLGAEKMQLMSTEKPRAQASPVRKALAPKSHNTPLRPAPPPPKMSVLEAATATAGAASVTQNKKKKNYISVNGKLFSRLECIGRGGSSRVYRVMAENYKQFALKRVSLEDVDEMAVRGFKGEIELLRKLEKVERVVRLFDYEINDEKKTLSVLMDMGELDLKKILDPRLDEETGRLDLSFTRHTWKEMLECVQSVHDYDVVHSDLKPANFVMIQGRLKLIDFGIANAIQDDTVNVHREHQIGTPNYMAPEALLDTNAMAGRTSNLGKLMKLGKPSDVWSLGCILYQIVYGKPPFGHIQNSMSKVMAITDRTHAINFLEHGLGGVPVPTGLIRTMRRCLNRDPALRPTILQLLDARDPFLYPDAPGTIPVTQEIVRKLQENVLKIIEAKGLPTGQGRPKDEAVKEWLDQWSPQLFASIKASLEKGAA